MLLTKFFLCILLISISQLTATYRDPFTSLQASTKTVDAGMQTKPKQKESVKDLNEQWTVQEVRKNVVVLKDEQGNIREISFSTAENKNPPTLEKAEGLGGNNT